MIINIQYVPQQADIIEAVKLYNRFSKLYWFNKVLGLILALLGCLELFLFHNGLLAFPFILFGATEILGIQFLHYIRSWFSFWRNPKFKMHYQLTFDDDGLTSCSEAGTSQLNWSYFSHYLENDKVILLIYGKGLFTVIPKRAFLTEAELQLFSELLYSKLPLKTRSA